jgi:hypothetical protein
LIRRPDDSFSIDFDSAADVLTRLRCALNASAFVFTRRDIEILLDLAGESAGLRLPAWPACIPARPAPSGRHPSVRTLSIGRAAGF